MFMFNFYRSRVPIEHREQRLADRTVKPYQAGKMSKKKKKKKKKKTGSWGAVVLYIKFAKHFWRIPDKDKRERYMTREVAYQQIMLL